jgi:hypothetical protein
MSVNRIDAIRSPDAVSPADRPVAAERDQEIRLRTEALLKKLGDGGKRHSPHQQEQESSGQQKKKEGRKTKLAAPNDAFDAQAEERAQVLEALGLEGASAPAKTPALSRGSPNAMDRAAMESAADKFLMMHVAYDYATNTYLLDVARLTHGIKAFLNGPHSAMERFHLIRAVLDAAAHRTPESSALVQASLAQTLAAERQQLERWAQAKAAVEEEATSSRPPRKNRRVAKKQGSPRRRASDRGEVTQTRTVRRASFDEEPTQTEVVTKTGLTGTRSGTARSRKAKKSRS